MIFNNYNFSNENLIVFIGSGVANLSCAIELSKLKKKIIILEAGSYNNEDQFDFFNGEVKGDGYDLNAVRYRGFMGTANKWFGWCKPIFDNVLETWGLKNLKLSKYNEKTLEFFNLKNDFKSNLSLNDYDNFEIKKCNTKQLLIRLKEEIKTNKNIDLILNCQVSKIELTKNNKYKIYFNNFKKKEISTRFLVLGAGCLENSRILLLSKKFSKKNFLKDHSMIGKKFYDHPQLESGSYMADYKNFMREFDFNYKNFRHELFFLRNNKLIEKNILNHTISLTFKTHPDQIKNFIRKSFCINTKFGDKVSKSLNERLCLRGILLNLTLGENNNSNISLSPNSFDPLGFNHLLLDYSWKNDKDILYTYDQVTKKFLSDLVKFDLGRGYLTDYEKHRNNPNSVGSLGHPSGGTAIGNSIENGCVDTNLELFNHNNFYVTGSSTFRRGNIINPTYTIVLFSHRLADRLSKLI